MWSGPDDVFMFLVFFCKTNFQFENYIFPLDFHWKIINPHNVQGPLSARMTSIFWILWNTDFFLHLSMYIIVRAKAVSSSTLYTCCKLICNVYCPNMYNTQYSSYSPTNRHVFFFVPYFYARHIRMFAGVPTMHNNNDVKIPINYSKLTCIPCDTCAYYRKKQCKHSIIDSIRSELAQINYQKTSSVPVRCCILFGDIFQKGKISWDKVCAIISLPLRGIFVLDMLCMMREALYRSKQRYRSVLLNKGPARFAEHFIVGWF